MCHRKRRSAELRIKRRGRERQDYTHGRLEKGSERERRGWEEKATGRGLRLQRRAPFVAEFSCDGRLMFRERVKESFSATP